MNWYRVRRLTRAHLLLECTTCTKRAEQQKRQQLTVIDFMVNAMYMLYSLRGTGGKGDGGGVRLPASGLTALQGLEVGHTSHA